MEPKKSKKKVIITRVIIETIIALGLLFTLGLFNKNFALFTTEITYDYTYPADKMISPIEPLVPETSINEKNGIQYQVNEQLIRSSAVKFSLALPPVVDPKSIKAARVKIDFEDRNLSEMIMGVQNVISEEYRYLPTFNSFLNKFEWSKIENSKLTLWQKEKNFESLEDFLNSIDDLSQEEKVLTYHYIQDPLNYIEEELAGRTTKSLSTSLPYLEGEINIYTFLPEKSALRITATKRDINYSEGEDITHIKVYDYKNFLLKQEEIPDDGIISANSETSEPIKQELTIENLKKGLYRISVGTPDTHTKVDINQPYVVFKDQALLIDERYNQNKKPYTIYTNSKLLKIPTWHVGATEQNITIDNSITLNLDENRLPGEYHTVDLRETTQSIIVPIEIGRNHIAVESFEHHKFFNFNKNNFFNPQPVQLKAFKKDSIEENNEYIISPYKEPQENEGYKTASLEFELNENYFTDGRLNFKLVAKPTWGSRVSYKIRNIEVILKK